MTINYFGISKKKTRTHINTLFYGMIKCHMWTVSKNDYVHRQWYYKKKIIRQSVSTSKTSGHIAHPIFFCLYAFSYIFTTKNKLTVTAGTYPSTICFMYQKMYIIFTIMWRHPHIPLILYIIYYGAMSIIYLEFRGTRKKTLFLHTNP